jgi:hypothetical protein
MEFEEHVGDSLVNSRNELGNERISTSNDV